VSYILSAAEKLESQLTSAYKEFCHTSEFQQTAFAHLNRLKKVHKRVHFKGWKQVKQGLYKLEVEEAKMGSNPIEVETADILVIESLSLAVYLLLLADPFFFNSSFFQLPDLLFYNTLQPFLLHS